MIRFVVVISVYLLIFAYPPARLLYWIEPATTTSELVLGIVFAAPALLYVMAQPKRLAWRRSVLRAVYFWLGTCFILLCAVLAGEIGRLLLPLNDATVGALTLVGATIAVALGVYRAKRLHVERVTVETNKVGTAVRVVQISDVHIGSRSTNFLERVVERVNALQPDVVMITGDLVDMHATTADELRALEKLQAPAFFSVGNHEIYVGLETICDIMEQYGITVLRGAAAQHGPLQIIGIDDSPSPHTVARELDGLHVDADRFSVLLYHRPDGLEDAADRGIDLMLCGHTHNGQIVPFNYAVKRQFPRIRGRYDQGSTTLYVSPGTGTWGPTLRLGSNSEITELVIQPRDG